MIFIRDETSPMAMIVAAGGQKQKASSPRPANGKTIALIIARKLDLRKARNEFQLQDSLRISLAPVAGPTVTAAAIQCHNVKTSQRTCPHEATNHITITAD